MDLLATRHRLPGAGLGRRASAGGLVRRHRPHRHALLLLPLLPDLAPRQGRAAAAAADQHQRRRDAEGRRACRVAGDAEGETVMRKQLVVLVGVALLALAPSLASSQESEPPLMKQVWSFDGPFGTIDRAAAQRGLEVYEEVCSKCHSLNLLHYGDLGPGGPGGGLGYTEEQVKAIASQHQVTDGPNDQGEMFQRPGRPADKFVAPFPN